MTANRHKGPVESEATRGSLELSSAWFHLGTAGQTVAGRYAVW